MTRSYEAIGLAASLKPTASGGVERPLGVANSDEGQTDAAPSAAASSSSGLRAGFGRIIRDAEGNIVDVELPDADADEETIDRTERLVEDVADPSQQDGLAEWVGVSGSSRAGKAHVVQGMHVRLSTSISLSDYMELRAIAMRVDLEALSRTRGGPVAQHLSRGELGVLRRLVAKYGDDVEAMARDRRLNVEQRTGGELARAIRKAGGVAALQAQGS